MNGQGGENAPFLLVYRRKYSLSFLFALALVEKRLTFRTKAIWRPGEDCTVEKWSPRWVTVGQQRRRRRAIQDSRGTAHAQRAVEHMASGASFQNKSTLHAAVPLRFVPVLTNNARIYTAIFPPFKLSKITLRDDNLPSYTMVLNYIAHFSCVMTITAPMWCSSGVEVTQYWLRRRRHMFVERSGHNTSMHIYIYTSDWLLWMLGFTHIYPC